MQCIVVVFDALYSTAKSHTNPKLYSKNIVFLALFAMLTNCWYGMFMHVT